MTVGQHRDWPGTQRVPTRHAELFVVRNFLDERLCAQLIEMIEANRRPSTIADDIGQAGYRTSETCDLDPANPAVIAVEQRLSAFTRIDPALGELLQGQRYAVGQEFKDHTDYFEPAGIDYAHHCGISGQRTWTAMVYLNRPAAGGATRFRRLGKIFEPEAGKLLCWSNLDDQGRPNGWTLHSGMKVRSGVKYVVTKWFRERPWRAVP